MFSQTYLMRDVGKPQEIKFGMEIKTYKQIPKQGHYLIGPQQLHMEEKCY